ncbi:MAG: serine hydrolase [Clostridiales bacterium]|nr:serine hydrolase [Clostridiales bacterium]MDY4061199.1 serine hydrolase [Anaerovoracaceae bacterium]
MRKVSGVNYKLFRVILVMTLVFVFLASNLSPGNSSMATSEKGSLLVQKCDTKFVAVKKSSEKKKTVKKQDKDSDKPSISSSSAVLYCENTGEMLFDQKSRSRIAPLSTTKIVTAILAIQNLQLSTEVEISESAAGLGGSMNLKPGEKISVESLLYGALIANSDDAAYALGEAVSAGDMGKFVKMMNEMVRNIGCKETHFTNPVGKPDPEHYSTANDMMQIMKVVSSNEVFAKISSSDKKDIKPTNLTPARSLSNSWPEVAKDRNIVAVQRGDGGDNGETAVLISYNYKGLRLVIAVMGAPKTDGLEKDANALIKYAVNSVRGIKVISKGDEIEKAYIKGGAKTRVPAFATDDGYAYLPKEGSKELIRGTVSMDENLKAPVKRGTRVGTYNIYVADDQVNKIPLVIDMDVEEGWFPSKVGISNMATMLILFGILCIIFIWIYIRIRIKQKKRRAALRRRKMAYQEALRQIEIEEDRRRRGWHI